MGRTKCKVDYLMEYGGEIEMLRGGLSLRRVRSKTGRSINTLRKLKRIFLILIRLLLKSNENMSSRYPKNNILPTVTLY